MSDLEATLAEGRLAARELMRETIRLYRLGDDGFDWSTGTDTPEAATVLYEGPARVKPSTQSRGEEVEAGEQNVTLREYTVSLPWDTWVTELPGVGDLIDVTTSPDERMVALRLWVTSEGFSSTATAWRIFAEDRS
ncbi:DUF6093 family protein [Streptomyces virginiae]|uniref:DUF6093 family protein n=1 Tax=Streptomyces virginiae TaxID=1961 RepID=UPI00344CE3EA